MAVKDADYKTWVKAFTGLYILIILEQGQAHGNKIAEMIKERTLGTVSPNPNALYPLLRAMEERGYLVGNWDNPETRNKRVYAITEKGKAFIPILREKVEERLKQAERKLQILRKDLFDNSGEDSNDTR